MTIRTKISNQLEENTYYDTPVGGFCDDATVLKNYEAAGFQRDTASYIETMITELLVMAHHARMDFLVYLLEMARVEASERVQNPRL